MTLTGRWQSRFITLILILWALQGLYLAWRFGPDLPDLLARFASHRLGAAVRCEDPFYCWLLDLEKAMPPEAAYIFLDQYEAGKYIEARYHLYPRRQILMAPQAPASFLYYALQEYQASFLIIRDRAAPLGPGAEALIRSTASRPLDIPGPGRAFQVDCTRLQGFFYD